METAKVSVVLVDDSTDVRTLVRMRLQASGAFDVVGEAADGEHAIELLIRHEPDLVLLDVSTPAMDGLETLPAIMAIRPETAVVMFTGFGGADLVAQVRELGAIDLIEKSIPLDQLADRLLRTLREASPGTTPVAAPKLKVVAEAPAETPAETFAETFAETSAETPAETSAAGDAAGENLERAGLDLEAFEQTVLDEHLEGFRALFDRAAIGMATLTVDATIVRANAALAELMSCEPGDLVGVDYGRLTGGLGDVLDHRLEVLRASQGNVATFEHPIPEPAGSTAGRTALVTLVPIRDSNQQVLYVFAQVQDITAQRTAEDELRLSEERFRLLVDVVEEYAIFMLDTEGVVMSWNAGARRIKGYESDEIVGRHFRVFYPVDEQLTGHPERNLEAAVRDGSVAEEGWRLRRDGSRFWASVVITSVRDDRGRHVGFAKITRDHSVQRQHAEDRLEAMAEQARLLAVTAHELRNPTAVIDGSAHALEVSEHHMTAEERAQFFRGIRSSADRLRRLAQDLAAASQLQGAGMQFHARAVSFPKLVRSTAARRLGAGPPVGLEVDVPEDTVIHADEVRLAQALDNLVDNAVRHGVAPIAMAAEVREDHVEVRVTDAGAGVPADLVPRLFDRFATAGATSGTGLGLYLVREIVNHHGGEVAYQAPEDGSPTTFTIRLPVGADQ